MTIYKIEYLNDEGDVVSFIVDEKRALMLDYERDAERNGCKYCFETQNDNPHNDNIAVEGYYSEGLRMPNGYPIRKYYQYHIKGGKTNWVTKCSWTRE